jgi:acetyl-CoA carboxylase biotin carboxyl carrier protein
MATAKKANSKPVAKPSKNVPASKKVSPTPNKVSPAPNKVSVTKPAEKLPSPIFNIGEINDLINAVNHSNVNELKLEKGDFKITIRQGGTVISTTNQVIQSAPAAPSVAAPAPQAAAPVAAPPVATDNLITIKSPMIGTFYRSSGPGKPLFVNVGDEIREGQVLCIVEAMKLFNEIESEISGKIVKILADDASPIEYDQPLFLVQP